MSMVAVAIGGSAVIGAISADAASSRAEAAANRATDAASDAARLQYDLGKETLQFQRDYYENTLKPLAEKDAQLRQRAIDDYMLTAKQQRDIAQDQYDQYKTTFRPIEERVAKDALGYDSQENVDRRMGIAAANNNQQFSNAAGQQARLLSRYGINPNSSTFARTNQGLVNAQALGSAGAQTGAAFDTMDRGIALRAGAANFGRNMPNSAGAFFAGSNNSTGGAASTSGQGMTVANNAVAPLLQSTGLASNAFHSAGAINNDLFRNQMNMYNSSMQGVGGMFQGIGSFAGSKLGQDALGSFWSRLNQVGQPGTGLEGMSPEALGAFGWANGGYINGPGGPRDDAVPALLSKGEFVLNEGAVKHFGVAKLNKMNEVGLKNQEARGLIRRS